MAVICASGWFDSTALRAQTTTSPLPEPTGFVNDYAGVLDAATKQRLETLLTNLKERAEIEFTIVTVPTTGDTPIFDYTLAVARGWGIGPGGGEQKGLILLVAINDRKYQIQVSRHLEGDLPDGLVGEVGRRMRDPFRQNRYGDGLELAAGTIIATLAEKRGFSLDGIDQSQAYRGGEPRRRPERGMSFTACCFILVVILILMAIFGRGKGRRGGGGFGGGGSGLMNALLVGSVLNSMSNSSGSGSSGWGGGDSGGGGGFGGFGGGGDFGGGGAGGDW